MLKTFSLLLLFLISCSPVLVTKADYDQDKFRLWDGPNSLSWDDFRGKPLDGALASEIYISNPSKIERKTLFHPVILDAKTLFDRQKSWVRPNNTTDLLLRYNQVLFNIYELHTRKLKKEFLKLNFSINSPTEIFFDLVNSINSELYNMVNNFREESKMGKEEAIINKWYDRIINQLEELNQYR
ncbi:MAG TPA: hypothetical protein ENK44_15420 [Caldithrix abyssi]|uniref:DUF922 domain-containing protein n=1 Tax=Caldithrix abyssi TaxID=187145 RepID=A0A7V4U358_CALAY|nr:hypothetical protein [Caldithrix abyssi]